MLLVSLDDVDPSVYHYKRFHWIVDQLAERRRQVGLVSGSDTLARSAI